MTATDDLVSVLRYAMVERITGSSPATRCVSCGAGRLDCNAEKPCCAPCAERRERFR